jgi:signal transduction histidine kinase
MLRQQFFSLYDEAILEQPECWGIALALTGLVGYYMHRSRLKRDEKRQAQTRNGIASNLHDELGSLLMRLHMQTESVLHRLPSSDLEQVLVTTQAINAAMRDVVWGLDPNADTVEALQDRMRDLVDQLRLISSLRISFATEGLEDIETLPNQVRQEIYLVFKEATTNVLRHAQGATCLATRLYRQKNSLVLEVQDNGTPFATPTRSGMGLRNMQERARKVGGKLETGTRTDGIGFRVFFCAPLCSTSWLRRWTNRGRIGSTSANECGC